MKTFLAHVGLAGFLALSAISISWAQGKAPSQPAPSQPPSGGNRTGNANSQPSTSQPNAETTPLYLDGQLVISDTGKPAGAVSIRLDCGMSTRQIVKTDLKGNFHFTLGGGLQADSDFSAADATADPRAMSSLPSAGGYSGFGTSGNGLTGCELRISTAGYMPVNYPITELPSLQTIDVGILELTSMAAPPPPGAVSVTSLQVPNNARKEYELGIKDLQNNRLASGTQHLERAVAAYDKYALAWNDLAKAYMADHQTPKARQAYTKAIAADSKYAPPYVGLAALQVEDMDNEGALDSIDKAAQADPAILMGVAGYIGALANFNLDRYDPAEQDLLQAEKGPHKNFPQLHAMFADILMRKQDTQGAAAQMRAYLKEAPDGHFAEQIKNELDQIQNEASNAGGAAAPALIAP